MKQSSLSISIPEPCHEKWSDMTPAEKGRHCKSCQKTVVDFTRMPKAQIVEFVSENQGEMCGRFSSDQLNVELIQPKPTKSWLKYAAIILGLVPTIGYGQEATRNINPAPTHVMNDFELGEIIIEDDQKTGKVNANTSSEELNSSSITGKVLDEATREFILFGKVTVYHSDKLFSTVETDLNGRFTIEVREGTIIEVSYVGYQSQKIKLDDIDSTKDLVIYLKEAIFGDFIITTTEDQHKNLASSTEIEHVENLDKTEIDSIKSSEQSSDQSEETLHYQFPAVEFNAEKYPATEITATGGYVLITSEERESWLKRQWKKFKSLVEMSHEEALQSKKIEIPDSSYLKKVESNDWAPGLHAQIKVATDKSDEAINLQTTIDVTIYPNPSLGLFTIEIPSQIEEFSIEVTNIKNQLILRKTNRKFDGTIDLGNYEAGTYIISVISTNQLISSKMVVKI